MVENCIASNGGSMMIQSSTSPTTSYISGLSDELLIEIFSRLASSECATQCKCICKRWFSLIDTNTNSSSDSYFLRRRRQINRVGEEDEELRTVLLTQYPKGDLNCHVIYSSLESPMFKPLNFLPCSSTNNNNFSRVSILATFKDLVLCSPKENEHSVYYICNPFTKQWTALPPPPPLPEGSLASRIQVGLIVSESDDLQSLLFKVVRVIPNYLSIYQMIVEMFSSDDVTNKWRPMVLPDEWRQVDLPMSSPISWNGMLVWLRKRGEVVGLKISNHSNVCSYFRALYPPRYQTHMPSSILGVCKGRLRIAQFVSLSSDANYYSNHDLVIWELDSHSQSWELVHGLDLEEVVDYYSRDSFIARYCYKHPMKRIKSSVLAFDPQDRDLLYLFFVLPYEIPKSKVNSYIYSCNVRKKTLKIIGSLPINCSCIISFPLLLPCWPTPVPTLSNTTSS